MTTELEEKFYKVFEIEPERDLRCNKYDTTGKFDCGNFEPVADCFFCENHYVTEGYFRPITSDKLLEIMCVLSTINKLILDDTNIEELKEVVLSACVKNCYQVRFKEKIQALFQEVEDEEVHN